MTCEPTDRLLQSLKVHAPGVTDAMVNLELFNVVDEFFRRTSAWHYGQDIELEENRYEYGFGIPEGSNVVRLLSVTHQGNPVAASSQSGITLSSLGELVPELTFPDGDASFEPALTDLNNGLFTYSIYRPDYISVSSVPDAEGRKYPLKMLLALTVSKGCLECDDCGDWGVEDWVWDMFFQEFYNGTLGNLYGMPAKPWSNPTLASVHTKRFRNGMAFRMQEARRGFNYGVAGWRFPRGGWV
jgi:hypothetical protein